jgi:CelD/BcsL family acetyltransferase involved in cellulose biosynthesis
MKVDVVDKFSAFERLKPNWNSVYSADPDASLFLSWDWMSKWLGENRDEWLILAAKASARAKDYVGFFPLWINTRPAKSGGFLTEIAMAGGNFADYTGLIVRPASADATIDAFARAIKAMNWAAARFSRMRVSDELHDRLVRAFPRSKFDILLNYPMIDSAGVDNSICLVVPLPRTWDLYLAGLSANTRQHLRRLLRNLDSDPELRLSQISSRNIDSSIDILIDFWARKWSARKVESLSVMQRLLRTKLLHYYELGILYLPVLWRGDQPLGAHASLIDGEKRVMLFFIGARDESCDTTQPALTLHAHGIRDAIEMGLTRYDFLRGNERYKYSFGSIHRRICNTIVHVKPGARRRTLFDTRSIPRAMTLLREQKSTGKLAEVETGYRQILSVDPNYMPAILGYAELKAAHGQMMTAEKLLRDLVARQGGSEAAWLALGQCLAAQHCWPESEACYCRALELNPRLAGAHYQLGLLHEARGNTAEAQRSYKKSIEIDPGYRDVKRRLIDVVLRSTSERTRVVDEPKASTS